jgi:hypothetical protein
MVSGPSNQTFDIDALYFVCDCGFCKAIVIDDYEFSLFEAIEIVYRYISDLGKFGIDR